MKKLLIVLLGVLLASGLFFFVKVTQFYRYIYTPKGGFGNILKPKPEKIDYSFLVLGYGGFYGGVSHDGGYLTDTIMLVNINTKRKQIHLISIPRDLWVKIPTKSGADFHTKINAVYQSELNPNIYPDVNTNFTGTKEDAALTKFIIGGITGLTVDNYAGIGFQGFSTIIDRLGGVDVQVEKTFDDYEYPIDGKETDLCEKDDQFKQVEPFLKGEGTPEDKDKLFKDHPDLEKFYKDITEDPLSAFPCRYEHLRFDKGLTHMDGATALKYVRSRHSLQDGSDFGRAARQQRLIEAVKDKVFTIGFIPKIIPLMDDMKDFIKTDTGPEDLQKLVKEAPHVKEYKISSIVLSTQNALKITTSSDGQSILVPNGGIDSWSSVKTMIRNSIDGITPTPVPTGTPTPASLKPSTKPSLKQ